MKYSIVIPAYKSGETIERCLKSILQVDSQDYEIIVVSDDDVESEFDNLFLVCKKHSTAKLKLIRNENQKGVSGARNTGIQYAISDYVWFVDADDTVAENWYEIWNASNDDADIILGGYDIYEYGNYARTREVERNGIYFKEEYVQSSLQQDQLDWLLNPVWNKLYKRELVQRIHFDEMISMGEDLLFNLQAVQKANRIKLIHEIVYCYRVGEELDNSCAKFHYNAVDGILKAWTVEQALINDCATEFSAEVLKGYQDSIDAYERELVVSNHGNLSDLSRLETRLQSFSGYKDTASQNPVVRKYLNYKKSKMQIALFQIKQNSTGLLRLGFWWKNQKRKRSNQVWAYHLQNENHINPKNKVYCIIHCDNADTGLFSYVNLMLAEINRALEVGWIPVIDMQNYPSPYLEDGKLHAENVWEYYFVQPAKINVDEAKNSGNYLEITCGKSGFGPYSGNAFFTDKYGEKSYWRKIAQKYLLPNSAVMNDANEWYRKHFRREEKVLGVLCRGTDYLKLRPTGHPIQPSIEMTEKKAKELMKKWSCNRLYLCTEDSVCVDSFRDTFGTELVYVDRKYVGDTGTDFVTRVRFERDDDARLQGYEYLLQILILAKCDCLLAGACGGSIGAELLSDGYEQEYIWNLGQYE